MKRIEIIKKYGKLSPAQEMATEFFEECAQPNSSIEFDHYTASVLINAFTSQEMSIIEKLSKKIKQEVEFNIYPHEFQIEVWFI